MTIGVSHDPATGDVVLVDRAARKIYDFAPDQARALAADLWAAASSGCPVLVVATAADSQQVRVAGEAADARGMADDLDRNAQLGQALKA